MNGASAPGNSRVPTGASRPQPLAVPDAVPAPRDIAFPGVIRLEIDAADTLRGIFSVTETLPVTAGPLTLLYPKWIPGDHSPSGPIDKLAGLQVTAGGQWLPWRRDPADAFAFHIEVPADVTSVEVRFQYLSPTAGDQGLVVIGPKVLNLQWHTVALYPAGYFVRNILVAATVRYPQGWSSATALRPAGDATGDGGTVVYETVAFDTLIDSPVMAGANARTVELTSDVSLRVFADRPDQLDATPEQVTGLRNLIIEAVDLFGAQHYDHYDILLALSDTLSGQGLEHHRCSEQVVAGDFFNGPHTGLALFDLLPHEFAHSWNGKFRRPADLWTPDYRTPGRNSLLWAYEGQTVFWDSVLAARSGAVPKADALDALAGIVAAQIDQAGRNWRPLGDTGADPAISARRPIPWTSWRRSEDYYAEGQLLWLDIDSIIRERTGGACSMDDFARAFFGTHDRDWGVLTYTAEDLAATLNQIAPYDWRAYFTARIDQVSPEPPLDWLARGGYRLIYTREQGRIPAAREAWRKVADLSFSVGLIVGNEGVVTRVNWLGPAFAAGITVGVKLLGVGGESYSHDRFRRAISAAEGGTEPLPVIVQQGEALRTVDIHWNGGLRYPHLEATGAPSRGLDALYAPRVTGPALPAAS